MKRIATILGVAMTGGCIMSLVCLEPLLALLFALGAGAVFAWIETTEQREFVERMTRTYGGDWNTR